jgi:hypothetical protein
MPVDRKSSAALKSGDYAKTVQPLKHNNNNNPKALLLKQKVRLNHGSPYRGSPDCIMRSAATFVNYVYIIGECGIFQLFG